MRHALLTVMLLAALAAAHPAVEPADPQDWWNEVLASRAIKAAEELPPPSEEDVTYHTFTYRISMTLDPGGSPLIKDAVTDLQIESDQDNLTQVVLDLVDLTVDGVYDDHTPCGYTYANDLITVTLNTPLDTGEGTIISVAYHGDPTDGMWYETDNGGVVYTCGCPFASCNWFPCRDWNFEKAPSTTVITIPSAYDVTSNGHLYSDVPVTGGHRVIFQNLDPIAPYLIMLSATDYSLITDTFHGDVDVPIDYYVYPGMEQDAHDDFDYTVPTCMAVYEDLFGSYPFERAGYCVSPLPYGGMEHQTCISLLASQVNGTGGNYAIFVHEMSHMWWGDAVTARTWKECWLNEGFATYCEVIYDEDQDGDAGRRSRLLIQRGRYDAGDYNNRSPIYDPDPLFGNLPYNKGSWVLNMLRHLMGDADFYACLADYQADRRYSWATTEILKDNTEDFWDGNEHHPDSDMDWFFDQWVYQAGHPEFEWWWWTSGSGANTVLHLHLDQVQSTDHDTPYVFEVPVDFGVDYATRQDEVVTVWMDERSQEFSFDLDDDVDSVELDPGYWLLCDSEDQTAVDMAEAHVSAADDGLVVTWETGGDVLGVELYRRDGLGETKLHERLLPASGRFLDRSLPGSGSYSYRLVAHAADGQDLEFTAGPADWLVSGEPLALAEPYPNPAAESVAIGFNLPDGGPVELSVYDLAGRRVATLVEGDLAAGRHEVAWDAGSFPAGVYLVRLVADSGSLTKRVVLAR
jgi:aminopeptidase N